ncbi:MAG: RHS repeat-associated core domain-containing protein [Planctomycetes bacterium]|nr:RHS repeat-associated core domain-containing protein [Planctomycetota bacterium]
MSRYARGLCALVLAVWCSAEEPMSPPSRTWYDQGMPIAQWGPYFSSIAGADSSTTYTVFNNTALIPRTHGANPEPLGYWFKNGNLMASANLRGTGLFYVGIDYADSVRFVLDQPNVSIVNAGWIRCPVISDVENGVYFVDYDSPQIVDRILTTGAVIHADGTAQLISISDEQVMAEYDESMQWAYVDWCIECSDGTVITTTDFALSHISEDGVRLVSGPTGVVEPGKSVKMVCAVDTQLNALSFTRSLYWNPESSLGIELEVVDSRDEVRPPFEMGPHRMWTVANVIDGRAEFEFTPNANFSGAVHIFARLVQRTHPSGQWSSVRDQWSIPSMLTHQVRGDDGEFFYPNPHVRESDDYSWYNAWIDPTHLPPSLAQLSVFMGGAMPWAISSMRVAVADPVDIPVAQIPTQAGYFTCPVSIGQISPLTSRVENPQLSHIHTATDFQSAGGASGCGPCGASAGAGGGITTELRINRIHRYADFTRPGSFGPGVFSNLDIQLTLWNHGEAGEIWDPSAASPIPLTRIGVGAFADQKRSAIAGMRLLAADGTAQVDADSAVTAVATQHDGTQWVFELVQAGLGGDADRQGRLVAIRDRAGNALSIAYAFPAAASDADLGNARARLLEMASAIDQRGRTVTFSYGWACGQPVVTNLTYPTGEHVVYHYDGDIAGVCRIDYPDGTQSTFGLREDAASQCMVVDYQDAGAEGTHRTKSVYLTKTAFTQADGTVVQQSPNRVRRVVGPTGEPTYLNWLERDGSQVKIYVYEGGGIGGTGRVYRLDTTEGVTDATFVATAWSFTTDPSTWTWEKVADYQADGLLRMGKQTDPRGVATVYDRDPASGAITGRTNVAADGSTLSAEKTLYNGMRQPTFHQDANGIITRSTYDEDGNLRFRTEGIVLAEDGVTEDDSNATTWEWLYRSDGQVLAEIDPLGRRTDYEYDPRGFRNAEVSPPDDLALPTVRARKEWHYDAAGRMDWSKDASGHVTNYDYDTRNRVWRIRYGNNTAETFEFGTGADANLLKARTDRDGVRTTFIYDEAGREISRTEGAQKPADAITTTTSYLEGTDLPVTVVRGGQRTDTIYDTRKRVHEVRRWVDGQRYLSDWTVYDEADRVAYTIDAHSRRTYSVYDDLGRVTRTIREATPGAVPADADLQTLARDGADNPAYVIDETSYDAGGRVLTTTDARGVVTKLGYDNLGRLIDRWEAFGTADVAHWHWAHDAVGNRLLERDPLGRETRFAYTGRNLLQSQSVAVGTDDEAVTSFTYTPTGQRHTQTDPNQHTTTWYYGACCDWLEKIVDAAGFATTYTYTGGGLLQTTLDASNHLTLQGYDGRNRPSTSTNGDQETITTAYDDDLSDLVGLSGTYATAFAVIGDLVGHQAVAVTNHLGEAHVRVTDGLGRVVLQIDPAGHATRTRYDEQVDIDGVLLVQTVQTDPLGHETALRYDGLGRMRQQVVQDPGDQVTTIAYDAAGNRRRVTDPEGHATFWTYDARNRQSSTTDAAGFTTGTDYDAMGNVLVLRDGRGKETRFTYTARNQKKTEKDRLGNTTVFSYDPAGNLLTISDAENEAKKATVMPEVYEAGKTRYTYTERNQLETERFPGETAARSYTYHPNGQLWTRTDQRGIVTTYGYDGANRLTTRAYSDAPADAFVLDDAGRITTATSGRYGTVVERTWKPTGLIETETTTWPADIGGVTSSTLVQYDYDAANRATTVTYPGGATLVREFTTRNQLDTLTLDGTQLAQAGYDNAGRRTSLLYGNGLTDTRTYTDDNRLESTVVGLAAPAQPVLSLGYLYDANRRKMDETDAITATRSQHFDYDDADRLKTWSAGTKSQSWDLSAVGDWNNTTVNGVVENREHTPVHEIAKVNNVLVLHDAAGNLARTAQGQGFSWDAENRLLMADIAPSSEKTQGQAFYWYDALGRRVAKRVHDSVTRYVHDGWQVIQELDAPVVATPAEAASDGSLANLATVPDGALLFPTYDAEGNRHNPVRVNFQPETEPIPDGFIADKGRLYDTRTNGLTYGWLDTTGRPSHTIRHFHPLPQYDTFGPVADRSTTWTWRIALPNGTYPVAIVAGDATSLAHTNNLVVNGQTLTDPDPGDDTTVPTYEQGDFDGWLVPVTITDGVLTITAGAGAFDPTLTHIEIGTEGQAITSEMQTRLADQILAATKRTGGTPFWNGGRSETRTYVWGSGIDELVAYQRTNDAGTQTYYAHTNAQYSVVAMTDIAGLLVESYQYDAYGHRVVGGPTQDGRSRIGMTRAFTGQELDEETGLMNFRRRMYSPDQGRFVSRDPMGYVDGHSLYGAYFVPNATDPTGENVFVMFRTPPVHWGLLQPTDQGHVMLVVVNNATGAVRVGDYYPDTGRFVKDPGNGNTVELTSEHLSYSLWESANNYSRGVTPDQSAGNPLGIFAGYQGYQYLEVPASAQYEAALEQAMDRGYNKEFATGESMCPDYVSYMLDQAAKATGSQEVKHTGYAMSTNAIYNYVDAIRQMNNVQSFATVDLSFIKSIDMYTQDKLNTITSIDPLQIQQIQKSMANGVIPPDIGAAQIQSLQTELQNAQSEIDAWKQANPGGSDRQMIHIHK